MGDPARRQSNALWPDGVCRSMWGDNISTDTHDSEAHAFGVCLGLERFGYGGDRKAFPLLVWTSEVQQPPQLPAAWNRRTPPAGDAQPNVRANLDPTA